MQPASPRRTKIVCTLGPASDSEERIESLIRAGMNVARINCSHGSQPEHAATIARVRAVAERLKVPVAVLADLQGPKIRTGPLVNGEPVQLQTGRQFSLTTEPVLGTAERVATTYTPLPRDVKPGDRILLSDGAIELKAQATTDVLVTCTVVHGGWLAEHQGINLPGVQVSAPALSEKDRADLVFLVGQNVDYLALSFVRRPSDIQEAKELIAAALAAGRPAEPKPVPPPEGYHPSMYAALPNIPVIAKLEKPEAIERLDAILEVADGVMVARGDLGVEMPLEEVPLVQKRVIRQANAAGLPVITATQMLESMIHNPRPTRAEASDVANAILDGTDALMLSGETAVGEYPEESVRVMDRIARVTESQNASLERVHAGGTSLHAVSAAAHTLSDQAHAGLIVVFTRTGMSARLISVERPRAPIVAYTPFDNVYRRLALWWGVTSHRSQLAGDTERLIGWVDRHLQEEGLAAAGTSIVVVGGMPMAGRARTNFIQLHVIGED
jgi:pyruvate kinase